MLTLDGVGEWTTTSVGIGRGNTLELTREIHFPHSIGLLYSAFTYYTGFKVNSGEYKVMGLAPYGEPKYAQTILDHLVDLKDDGSLPARPRLLRLLHRAHHDLAVRRPVRRPAARAAGTLTQRHMDLAASVQKVTEEVMLRLTRVLRPTAIENLCLAGGVALNCVANGKVLRDGVSRISGFSRRPAMPAARSARRSRPIIIQRANRARHRADDGMRGAYLGPEFSQAESRSACGSRRSVRTLDDEGAD